jgi:hypothetical protein
MEKVHGKSAERYRKLTHGAVCGLESDVCGWFAAALSFFLAHVTFSFCILRTLFLAFITAHSFCGIQALLPFSLIPRAIPWAFM